MFAGYTDCSRVATGFDEVSLKAWQLARSRYREAFFQVSLDLEVWGIPVSQLLHYVSGAIAPPRLKASDPGLPARELPGAVIVTHC